MPAPFTIFELVLIADTRQRLTRRRRAAGRPLDVAGPVPGHKLADIHAAETRRRHGHGLRPRLARWPRRWVGAGDLAVLAGDDLRRPRDLRRHRAGLSPRGRIRWSLRLRQWICNGFRWFGS